MTVNNYFIFIFYCFFNRIYFISIFISILINAKNVKCITPCTINREKEALAEALNSIEGFELVGDRRANFILFRYAKAQALMQYLVSQGMLIRDQSKQLNLQNCLRVSIGTEEQNQRLMQLINEFKNNEDAT